MFAERMKSNQVTIMGEIAHHLHSFKRNMEQIFT